MSTNTTLTTLDYTLQCRKNLLALMNTLSWEELNTKPSGFNNTILWNAGHSIVAQQVLCYKLAGQKMLIDEEYVALFMKGTKALDMYDESIKEFITSNAITLIIKMKEDFNSLDFSQFKTYTTSFGTTLSSIDDAIAFNSMHEALHFGYIMAQKRTLLTNK